MVTILTRGDLSEKDYLDLIKDSKNALIYTDLSYLDAITEYTRSELYFAVELMQNRMIGALPFCVFFGEYGPVINSLPFYGSNGGILHRNKTLVKDQSIINAVLDFAKSIKCVSVTIIESPLNVSDEDVFSEFKYRDSRICLLNFFEPNIEPIDLLKTFHDSRPRNIRKAEKNHIIVKESHSAESIQFLADTHLKNISRNDGKPKSFEFFDFFLNKLATNQWVILEALYKDIRIASLLLLYNKNVIEYFTPATLDEYRNLQAQTLLIFTGMRFAIIRDILIWNWGGTWETQKGVYDFKVKWGPRQSKYKYFCAVLDDSILEKDKTDLIRCYPYYYIVPFKDLKV
jgi:hypothetical protein